MVFGGGPSPSPTPPSPTTTALSLLLRSFVFQELVPDVDADQEAGRSWRGAQVQTLIQWSSSRPPKEAHFLYRESIHQTRRRKTRTVMAGNVALGSDHPIRIQTMTTPKTVEKVMRIADKGADFEIKNTLVQKNVDALFQNLVSFGKSALNQSGCGCCLGLPTAAGVVLEMKPKPKLKQQGTDQGVE